MFCEGTRFTSIKHKESMIVAREKGLPELKHHLLPRTKGFSLLAKGAPGRSNYLHFFFKNHLFAFSFLSVDIVEF